jgi:hypothetical protein
MNAVVEDGSFWTPTAGNSREETSSRHSEMQRGHTEGTKWMLIGPIRHATRLSLPFLEFRELLQGLRGFHVVLHLAIRARQQKKRTRVV